MGLALSTAACSPACSEGSSATGDLATTTTKASGGEVSAGLPGGRIVGTVTFHGKPNAQLWTGHYDPSRACGGDVLASNELIVNDGKLRDVFVRLAEGTEIPPEYLPPPQDRRAVIERVDCRYEPRMQGVMLDQRPGAETRLEIHNSSPRPHDLMLRVGATGVASPYEDLKRFPLLWSFWDEPAIYTLTCFYHRWERSFVVTTTHPYFAVTGDDGRFALEGVPPGTYEVESWHSRHGWKHRLPVVVTAESTTTVDLAYSGNDPLPIENISEDFGVWSRR